MAKYFPSPIGEFEYPWINTPDVKYNKDGLFHVDLILGGQEAQDFKALCDTYVDDAWERLTADMLPKDVKKFGKVYPYEVDEDDDGNPTGYIKFGFKQNHKIKISKGPQAGTVKKVYIEVRDSEDDVVDAQIFDGTEGRVMYAPRDIKVASSMKIGARLDFAKVQVIKLAEGSGGSGGFGAVEGGYKGKPKADPGQHEGQAAEGDEEGY